MKYIKKSFTLFAYIYIVAAVLGLTSCDPVTENPPVYQVQNKTVLIYMVANNNLSGNAKEDLEELKNGFVPTNDNLVVFYHTTTQTPILLHIYKESDGRIVQDTSYRFPDRNSASAETLKSVLKVTQTLYPANEYGLMLWSHGTGWLPKDYYEDRTITNTLENVQRCTAKEDSQFKEYPNGIDPYSHLVKSFGADDGVEMEIRDLANALTSKFEFVIFDACLMGGIEVAYELKDSVSYVIASPTETLTDGFPYAAITQHMFSSPVNAEQIAEEYFNYYNSLSGTEQSATIAAIKTSELENVAAKAKTIFDKYRDDIPSLDLSQIQKYFRGNKYWFYDIKDFMQQLAPTEYAPFCNALDKAVIWKGATNKFLDITIDPARFSGVSIYIPTSTPDNNLNEFYKKYKWNKDSNYFPE